MEIGSERIEDYTKHCLASLSGDPRFYTTSIAVRDLDDVRALFADAPGAPPQVRFVDGQALTWYGSRIDWGLRVLGEALAAGTE